VRLFVAINFSNDIKNTLLRAISELREKSASGNFTRPENLHLTLAFIGEATDAKAIRGAIDRCAAKPFSLTVSGSGHFGDLYWVGIENNPKLKALAESLQNDLRTSGFDIEDRAFKPHITIARQLPAASLVTLNVPRTSMTVTRISLMKSERVNGKLTYTEVYGRNL
jgi:RNA 2',3'-cyclic 3'-phosphodiesterase